MVGLCNQAGAPQGLLPAAPADPYVRDERMRFLKSWLRCPTAYRVHDHHGR